MGPSGAGKSTFVNTLMGRDVASVGHDLESHTTHVQHFVFPDPTFPKRRIVVIDTPGFDGSDADIDDREVLRRIAGWLAQSYNANMKLAGVIYLYKINDNRMARTARQNLDLFKTLCGNNAAKKIVLTTTMWSEVSKQEGERREAEIRQKFWKDMLVLGAHICRLDDMEYSAPRIVNILTKDVVNAEPLQIQREMGEKRAKFEDTEAARLLSSQHRGGFRSGLKRFLNLLGRKF
ncbi:P-loop containing nucleoside triphosphate hydrolase protein [Lyophyllum atratum]|nr:P-loop containing nucleoside triphosphate hydrolase protein [Lyophyllum atratum]